MINMLSYVKIIPAATIIQIIFNYFILYYSPLPNARPVPVKSNPCINPLSLTLHISPAIT